MRTGKRGRPRKYHCEKVFARASSEEEQQEPRQLPVDEDKVNNSDGDACTLMTAIEVPLNDALKSEDKEEWFETIYVETKCLVANYTWERVERSNDHNVISCRTVLCNKFNPDGSIDRDKARIVSRGFSQRPRLISTANGTIRRTRTPGDIVGHH